MHRNIACPACKGTSFAEPEPSNNVVYQFENVSYSYEQCQLCGLLRALPMPSDEVIAHYYKSAFSYDAYKKLEPFKKQQARSRAVGLSKFISTDGRYLDLGAGHGYLVEAMKSKTKSAIGFDLAAASETIVNDGYTLYYADNLNQLPESHFNLITMYHTLEHITDPVSFLTQIKELLEPGGKLIIAVPNIESKGYLKNGNLWNWLQTPIVHPHHYTARALQNILANVGLKVKITTSHDAWDSNIIDSVAIFRKPKNVIRKNLPSNFAFWFDNTVRLAFTPFSYVANFFDKKGGAELWVMAEK